MSIEPRYHEQVRLLVALLPFLNDESCFALKGGTAINLFVQPFPKLQGKNSGEIVVYASSRAPSGYTVAIGVTGEPMAPGNLSGGAVSKKRCRSCACSQSARSRRYQSSAKGKPNLNRQ